MASPHPSPPLTGREILWLALILGLATALRLHQLGLEGLWYDECQTLLLARLPLEELPRITGNETQAPLLPLVVRVVDQLFGHDAWLIRFPATLAGVLAVALTWVCGRQLLSPGGGLMAAFLLAIHPMAIHYSQEARPYSLLMAGSVGTLAAAVHLGRSPTWRAALSVAVVILLVLYSHGLGAFSVLGAVLAAILLAPLDRVRVRQWALAGTVIAVGFLPWLGFLASQVQDIQTTYAWAEAVWQDEFPWQLVRSFAALSHGALIPIRNRAWDPIPAAWVGAALGLALVVAAFLARRSLREPRAPLALGLGMALPLVALFLICWSTGARAFVVGKADAPHLPLLTLLLAAGAHALRPRLRALVPLAFTGLALLPLEVHWRFDFRSQEQHFVDALSDLRQPGEVLVATFHHHCLTALTGLRWHESLLLFPDQAYQHPTWVDWSAYGPEGVKANAESIAVRAVNLSAANGASRVWLELADSNPQAHLMAEALDERLSLRFVRHFPQLRVQLRCYEIPGSEPVAPEG